MSYWTETAKSLDRSLLDTRWASILRDSLKDSPLQLSDEDLEAYILCRVHEATTTYQEAIDEGIDEQAANEIAMETLIPIFESREDGDEETEDWEMDGGIEDAIGGLETWLKGSDDERMETD